jgi:hypothetical protein
VIAEASNRCIEDQDIIDRILAHLYKNDWVAPTLPLLVPPPRAPPRTLSLFGKSEFITTTLNQQNRH